MSGRPQRRALAAELLERTRAFFEDDASKTTLDYVCAWVERPSTCVALAADLSAVLGFDVSYSRLERMLDAEYGETKRESALRGARSRASHSLAEQSLAIVDHPVSSTVDVAQASSRAKARQWLAGKWNPQDYGERQRGDVHISIGSLHLDALRLRSVPDSATCAGATLPPGAGAGTLAILGRIDNAAASNVPEVEVEVEAAVVEDATIVPE